MASRPCPAGRGASNTLFVVSLMTTVEPDPKLPGKFPIGVLAR